MRAGIVDESKAALPGVAMAAGEGMSVWLSHRLDEVEPVWRSLEANGIISPAQSFDVLSLWARHFRIPQEDQVYLVGIARGRAAALLPLWRTRIYGLRTLTWMTGEHFGAHAPLVDRDTLSVLTPEERALFWKRMLGLMPNADVLHLAAVPAELALATGFAAATESVAADYLYRSRFPDWATCDAERRDKHRRKVDRQQGTKLAALGAVEFCEIGPGSEAAALLDTMFSQKATRFAAQGIKDPFSDSAVRAFYKAVLAPGSAVDGLLHVLRLDGDPIAVRCNVRIGAALYALISSMSCCERVRAGSPGKQNLLRVMQTAFDAGVATIDMGKGPSDEKRLWCNEIVPLSDHYAPLSGLGRICLPGLMARRRARETIKGNPQLYGLARRARSLIARRPEPR